MLTGSALPEATGWPWRGRDVRDSGMDWSARVPGRRPMALEILESHPASAARATPLLLVHGAWHGAWCWADRALPDLASRGYHAYAVSLRGHGGSPGRPSLRRASLGDYVEDVLAAAASLPAPPVLVGHSMGGLAVQLALARGARASAGVLLAAVPPGGVVGAALRLARRHPLEFLQANATLRLWPMMKTPALAAALLLRPGAAPEEAARLHARLQDESYLAFLGMMLPGLDPRRVKVPVLVVGAGADAIFTEAEVRATARAYGVEATMIPGAGHDLMLDPAWDQVADRLVAWLGEHGL
jgi:pimeloyl-ACP methyl ester carboxylesterase